MMSFSEILNKQNKEMIPNISLVVSEEMLQDTYTWEACSEILLFKLYVHSCIASKKTGIFSVWRSSFSLSLIQKQTGNPIPNFPFQK